MGESNEMKSALITQKKRKENSWMCQDYIFVKKRWISGLGYQIHTF